ncbi:hypothetical protein MSG28_012605 [Choristoneura fumiferana]|uniref:Uncharacterized protein n=1 Tax=Choristoneura fumiferana TaxID=7141 RepID=A0ACC0JH68_CHOFU|nr:hypothetical protein MSG28_012605 [Choristoneura fumiferana]
MVLTHQHVTLSGVHVSVRQRRQQARRRSAMINRRVSECQRMHAPPRKKKNINSKSDKGNSFEGNKSYLKLHVSWVVKQKVASAIHSVGATFYKYLYSERLHSGGVVNSVSARGQARVDAHLRLGIQYGQHERQQQFHAASNSYGQILIPAYRQVTTASCRRLGCFVCSRINEHTLYPRRQFQYARVLSYDLKLQHAVYE